MKKLWKNFDALSSKCYEMAEAENHDEEIWEKAYAALNEVIRAGREQDSNYAAELYLLDDSTDFLYDVEGWLEDYLDHLEIVEKSERLIQVCNELINLFKWQEDSPSDLRFRISAALGAQGKSEEALGFCEAWYTEENDNIYAAVALIYARMGVADLKGAEQIVDRYISEDTPCSEDNDILFIAAELLYQVNGNEEAKQRMAREIKKYEEMLEKMFDDDLPFNVD